MNKERSIVFFKETSRRYGAVEYMRTEKENENIFLTKVNRFSFNG